MSTRLLRFATAAVVGVATWFAGPAPASATVDYIVGNGAAIPGYPAGFITTTKSGPSSNPIVLPLSSVPADVLGLDPYYELSISVTDFTSPANSTYSATLGGSLVLPLTQIPGTTTYSDTVILDNGPTPPDLSLVITNLFQLNNPRQTSVQTDTFTLTVGVAAATPEPASLALLGAGMTLLGLARRRRAPPSARTRI